MITSRMHNQMLAVERDFVVRKYVLRKKIETSLWLFVAAMVVIFFSRIGQ